MLDTLVAISSILGSLSLVVSVVLLMRELRETNRLTRAANAQALVDIVGPFYLSQVQDRQMAEFSARGAHKFDQMDEVDQHRYRCLLIWWLIFYENVYYQRRNGLLDRHAFQPWWHDLRVMVQEHNLAQHWDRLKSLFQPGFAEEVTALIAGTAPHESPQFSRLTETSGGTP
jgi:hypothetical protein